MKMEGGGHPKPNRLVQYVHYIKIHSYTYCILTQIHDDISRPAPPAPLAVCDVTAVGGAVGQTDGGDLQRAGGQKLQRGLIRF